MSNPVPESGLQGDQVSADASTTQSWPGTLTPGSPEWFAATPYDVMRDVTMPDGTVLPAGSTTTPAALGLAGDIPAVHAMVVAGDIWPTGVAH